MPTVEIVVKGAAHYEADSAITSGSLMPGVNVDLVPEEGNPHDANAVAVVLRQSGAKLGHISRDLAPRYREIVTSGKLERSVVRDVAHKTWSNGEPRLRISISITYQDTPKSDLQIPSNFARRLPEGLGVYRINNRSRRRFYIGSSANVRVRVGRHFNALRAGTHDNALLQDDYSLQRGVGFDATLLAAVGTADGLAAAEASAIRTALVARQDLYNFTIDGQGRVPSLMHDRSDQASPISDRVQIRARSYATPSANQALEIATARSGQRPILTPPEKEKAKAKAIDLRVLWYILFVAVVLWLLFRR